MSPRGLIRCWPIGVTAKRPMRNPMKPAAIPVERHLTSAKFAHTKKGQAQSPDGVWFACSCRSMLTKRLRAACPEGKQRHVLALTKVRRFNAKRYIWLRKKPPGSGGFFFFFSVSLKRTTLAIPRVARECLVYKNIRHEKCIRQVSRSKVLS